MNQRGAAHKPGRWASTDVPDQRERTVVVTGANTGIGFHTARILAERGATVVLACRDLAKADHAAARIATVAPRATVTTLRLDLASLSSVRQAAERLRASYPRLDLLIDNAGVMMTPYGRTEDGFELQLGINHLGHFALTGLLLDRLLAAPESRVVVVSSEAHRQGRIDFDRLQSEPRYRRTAAYGRSKLANLLFTYELQRRLAAAGARTIAVAAHPGFVPTELQRHLPAPMRAVERMVRGALGQRSAAMGALATLRAATDPAVRGGEYYGPQGWFRGSGYPIRIASSARSHDTEAQRRLWELSERLTGVGYRLPAPAAHPAAHRPAEA